MQPAERSIVAIISIFIVSMAYFGGIYAMNLPRSEMWIADSSTAVFGGIIGAIAYDAIRSLHQ